MKRRTFIKLSIAAGSAAAIGLSCKGKRRVKGSVKGASSSIGHLLREQILGEPVSFIKKEVVIVGSGISGLSAARQLHRKGLKDFLMLELEEYAGGNAASGHNEISSFPLGAHYVPIPNPGLQDYLDFLKEEDVITSFDGNGLPVYNEAYLCFDPEERLFINGHWQDGLVPSFGVPETDLKQIAGFLSKMQQFRLEKGSDGKDAFAIPVNNSSTDIQYRKLDEITMKQWMEINGFTSTYLQWYVNYCTRDDFGTCYHECSAWAGIHYFAGRKGVASNATYSDVLTWPEGNGFLVSKLEKAVQQNILTGSLVIGVELKEEKVVVKYLDVAKKEVRAVIAEHCILCVPQFVAARLLKDKNRVEIIKQKFRYTPWMVVNIVTPTLEERSGEVMSWDNVIYNSQSLGYVNATHQLLQQQVPRKNLTYYLPLTSKDPSSARKEASEITHDEWVQLLINDLKIVHPDIEDKMEEVNITLWGHAMAQPLPGMIHGGLRNQLSESIAGKIHFAHTDLAGISIFEEGFYQGINAANKIINYAASV